MKKTIGDVTFRWRRSFLTAPQGNVFSETNKPVRWPLTWRRSNEVGKISVASHNVTVAWRLTARRDDRVGLGGLEDYRVGVTNTVLFSERTWYYGSARKARLVDHVTGAPVWDGMTEDECPWYDEPAELEKLDDGDRADFPPGSRKGDASATIYFNDAPYTGPFDACPDMGRLKRDGGPLFLVNGFDTFCLWLAVEDPAGTVHVLDSFPWYVRYGLRVEGGKVDRDASFRFMPTAGTYLLSQGPRFSRVAKLQGMGSEGATRYTPGTYTRSEVENIIGYFAHV